MLPVMVIQHSRNWLKFGTTTATVAASVEWYDEAESGGAQVQLDSFRAPVRCAVFAVSIVEMITVRLYIGSTPSETSSAIEQIPRCTLQRNEVQRAQSS
eukprot:IDg8573t1